jgi:hypothetical protein
MRENNRKPFLFTEVRPWFGPRSLSDLDCHLIDPGGFNIPTDRRLVEHSHAVKAPRPQLLV